jgi:hypothetical protein
MSSTSAILIALGVALSFTGGLAAQPPVEAQKQPLVCRGGGARTLGSHMRTRRRCLTAAQWQQEDEARERAATGLQVTEGQNDGRATVMPR